MRRLQVFCIGLITLLSWSCSSPSDPEAEIRNVIEQMQTALDERNNADFRKHLADSFLGGHKGQRNIGRDDARKMLAGYFLRYRNVGVAMPALSIEIDPYERALATMQGTAALTGGNANLPETVRIYRFDGQWRHMEGRWQLIQFSWE